MELRREAELLSEFWDDQISPDSPLTGPPAAFLMTSLTQMKMQICVLFKWLCRSVQAGQKCRVSTFLCSFEALQLSEPEFYIIVIPQK